MKDFKDFTMKAFDERKKYKEALERIFERLDVDGCPHKYCEFDESCSECWARELGIELDENGKIK